MTIEELSPSQRRFLQTYQDRYRDVCTMLDRAREMGPGTFATLSLSGDDMTVAINIEFARAALRAQEKNLEASLEKMGVPVNTT